MLTKFIQPSIEILNLRIDEPVTSLTDILLAVICLSAYFRLRKLERAPNKAGYFRFYFLILGVSAFTGGLLGHAFQYCLAEDWKLISWTLTLASVAWMVQSLLRPAAPFLRRSMVRMISLLNILTFLAALIWALRTIDFDPVKYYSVFGLVLLTGFISIHLYRQTGNRGVLFLMGGVGLGFVSAITFSLQWGFSHWFNHRDVSHMILCFSIYLVYRGCVSLVGSVAASG